MILKFLQSVYIFFTYFIAPPFCLYCRQNMSQRQALCSTCMMSVLPIVPYDFHIAKNQTIKIYAMSAYKDPIKKLILSKHSSNSVPFYYLAQMMAQQSMLQHLDFDIITFIPLHWTRYALRGFNQAEIIAEQIGKATNARVLPLLIRSKKTQFQARLTGHEREHNVQDAFMIDPKYQREISGRKILLIDDLFTTGSTIKAAANVLLTHTPSKIEVFVVCRVASL